jgi:hypothetical protein
VSGRGGAVRRRRKGREGGREGGREKKKETEREGGRERGREGGKLSASTKNRESVRNRERARMGACATEIITSVCGRGAYEAPAAGRESLLHQ